MGFVRAGKTSEVPAGTIKDFQVEGTVVAVANVAGTYYAITNSCLHRGGPLGQGVMEGPIVTCPWHGWQFDVTNGKVAQNGTVGVGCYPTEIRGDDIFVNISD